MANVGEIEAPVEAAVILSRRRIRSRLSGVLRKGIRHIVIESAVLLRQARRVKILKGSSAAGRIHSCRFIGPNCSGIINTHHRMVQSIGAVGELRRGNIGLIAQAGVYAAGMLWGLRQIMDFAIVATIGNKADLNETDILEYFGEDDAVEVICLYLEDVKSGRRFIDTARGSAKPVIILKAGRTEAGKIAVTSLPPPWRG